MFLTIFLWLFTSALICSAAPTLENEHCGKPGEKEGATLQGNWNAETYFPGTVATFTCVNGYSRDGPIRMACIEGLWLDISKGQCKIYCSKPQQNHENGELEGQWNDETFPPGKVAIYICRQGYRQTSTFKMACIEGEWITISKGQCIKDSSCGPPPKVTNGVLKEQIKATYLLGERVTYDCASGYTMGQNANYITCENSFWTEPPVCRRIGQTCGPPPVVQFGDITEIKQRIYSSGSSVLYKCANYYKLEGNNKITCKDGEWEKEPVCREPCTVKETDLQQNNIQLKWTADKTKKLYSIHFDYMTFECKPGYQISDPKLLRTQCLDGVLKFPKCLKEGIGQTCGPPPVVQFGDITEIKQRTYSSGSSVLYKCANYYKLEGNNKITCKDGEWEKEPVCREPCTVKETDLQQNNIQHKWTADTFKKLYSEHFDNMTFECKPGYQISDPKLLRIQCLDGVLKYPRCLKEGSCPPPDISNAILSPEKQDGYISGSSVNIKCEDTFVLSGQINVKCENGQWDELPQCLKPCTIYPSSLERNHIELLPRESAPEILEHGTEVNVKCKANFKRQGSLIAVCNDGEMKYQRCFSGGTCRIIQNQLDMNFLELDEKHDNEVFYEEGETVSFNCKTGYINRNGLTGICTKSKRALTYPTCEEESAV